MRIPYYWRRRWCMDGWLDGWMDEWTYILNIVSLEKFENASILIEMLSWNQSRHPHISHRTVAYMPIKHSSYRFNGYYHWRINKIKSRRKVQKTWQIHGKFTQLFHNICIYILIYTNIEATTIRNRSIW